MLAEICILIFVPVVLFSIAKTKLEWYIYYTYPFIAIIIAYYICYITGDLVKTYMCKYKKFLYAVIISILIISEFFMVRRIIRNTRVQDNVQNVIYEAAQMGHSANIYVESGVWEQKHILSAKMYGDLHPMNGGRISFEKDRLKGAILINKNLEIERNP
ncbi:MAG: hypothetical protein LBQ63_03620 [Deltaproteobacteria bacterium]|jgi:predicted PurR-regulated permease PerM|nr:hypothetical protein [Deltaproteobacteria bacterium]